MADGLPAALGKIGSESIADSSITSSDILDATVANADLANNAASGAKVSPEYPIAYAGSPSVSRQAIQAGTATTAAGSEVWFTFGTAFGAAPTSVIATTAGDTSAEITIGSISAGSCLATSHDAASVAFTWVAIGSGRV